MSLGIVRGMRDEPTQMMESVVQVHPEGHLNIRFDRDSWNEQMNSKVTKRHFPMEERLSFVRCMAFSGVEIQTLVCPARSSEMLHEGLTSESAALVQPVSALVRTVPLEQASRVQ